MLEEAYEQVIRQYKEQHDNRLPWENEREGGPPLKIQGSKYPDISSLEKSQLSLAENYYL
jgi:hypothetical protein